MLWQLGPAEQPVTKRSPNTPLPPDSVLGVGGNPTEVEGSVRRILKCGENGDREDRRPQEHQPSLGSSFSKTPRAQAATGVPEWLAESYSNWGLGSAPRIQPLRCHGGSLVREKLSALEGQEYLQIPCRSYAFPHRPAPGRAWGQNEHSD